MNKLASDAYDFGCESAFSLFFKEAAAGGALGAGLKNLLARTPRPGMPITTPKIPGSNLPLGMGGEQVMRARIANPRPVPVPTGFGRTVTGSVRTKQAVLDLALGAGLGGYKASKSKAHPDEVGEGAVRGAAGLVGGGALGGITGAATGGILGLAAGHLLNIPSRVGPTGTRSVNIGPGLGALTGAGVGSALGGGYGAYRGYKHLTRKYDE